MQITELLLFHKMSQEVLTDLGERSTVFVVTFLFLYDSYVWIHAMI